MGIERATFIVALLACAGCFIQIYLMLAQRNQSQPNVQVIVVSERDAADGDIGKIIDLPAEVEIEVEGEIDGQ